MPMGIGGLLKSSFCDWPGRVAAVVFVRGCNFRCPWCHNPSLVDPARFGPAVPEEEVLGWLVRRKGVLGGVVVSGGEPTLWPGLEPFLEEVRRLGLPVKLDTNGSRPDVVRRLKERGLAERVAADYKLPLRLYGLVGCRAAGPVAESLRLADWVRTTVVPGVHTDGVLAEMRREFEVLGVSAPWRFQPFKSGSCLDPAFDDLRSTPVGPARPVA
jgi:pyruvate formate lyase activating enzyme